MVAKEKDKISERVVAADVRAQISARRVGSQARHDEMGGRLLEKSGPFLMKRATSLLKKGEGCLPLLLLPLLSARQYAEIMTPAPFYGALRNARVS